MLACITYFLLFWCLRVVIWCCVVCYCCCCCDMLVVWFVVGLVFSHWGVLCCCDSWPPMNFNWWLLLLFAWSLRSLMWVLFVVGVCVLVICCFVLCFRLWYLLMCSLLGVVFVVVWHVFVISVVVFFVSDCFVFVFVAVAVHWGCYIWSCVHCICVICCCVFVVVFGFFMLYVVVCVLVVLFGFAPLCLCDLCYGWFVVVICVSMVLFCYLYTRSWTLC